VHAKNEAAAALLAGLEAAAEAARSAEDRFRRETAARIDTLAQERAYAFRRLNFVRAIAEAARVSEDGASAVEAARAAVRRELGWQAEDARRSEILERLQPVLLRITAQLGGGEPDAGEVAPEDVIAALREFESWFQADTGTSFYALFDRYVPETPVVDF
jgi:hypothetical protein